MTQQQLYQWYTTHVEPNDGSNGPNNFGDRFNAWAGGLAQKTGAQSFESIPDDIFSNPQYGLVSQPALSQGIGANLNGLVGSGTLDAANTALQGGATRANTGGNTNQVQGGTQTGQYGTTGTNYGTTGQTQTGTNTQSGVNTGLTNTSGTNTGTSTSGTTGGQTGTTSTTGQTTGQTKNTVVDQYGLGGLAGNLTGTAGANDAARTKFLTDTLQTGDPQLQHQISGAVSNALSGPGMQGIGNSAQARAADYAAQGVADNAVKNQLSAASQLAGPSASGTAIQQGSSLLGSQSSSSGSTSQDVLNALSNFGKTDTSNTGTNTGVTTTGGTNTSSGTTGMTGTTNQSGGTTAGGTASGSNIGIATGQVPQQQVNSGSGCFVCTAYVDRGWMHPGAIRAAVYYKLNNKPKYERSLLGYVVFGPLLALAVLRSKAFARAFYGVARAVLYEECRLARPDRIRRRWAATVCHIGFHALGLVFSPLARRRYTEQRRVVEILDRHGLNYGRNW